MSTWLIGRVFRVLVERQITTPETQFTAPELARWLKPHMLPELAADVTATLLCLRMIASVDGSDPEQYQLTPEGVAAVLETMASLRKAPRKARPPAPGSLCLRLWSLVKMRAVIDSTSAAKTLSNAGEEEYEAVRNACAKFLRRWADAGAMEESARRVKGTGIGAGSKRYVLKPEWKNKLLPPSTVTRREARA